MSVREHGAHCVDCVACLGKTLLLAKEVDSEETLLAARDTHAFTLQPYVSPHTVAAVVTEKG